MYYQPLVQCRVLTSVVKGGEGGIKRIGAKCGREEGDVIGTECILITINFEQTHMKNVRFPVNSQHDWTNGRLPPPPRLPERGRSKLPRCRNGLSGHRSLNKPICSPVLSIFASAAEPPRPCFIPPMARGKMGNILVVFFTHNTLYRYQ